MEIMFLSVQSIKASGGWSSEVFRTVDFLYLWIGDFIIFSIFSPGGHEKTVNIDTKEVLCSCESYSTSTTTLKLSHRHNLPVRLSIAW